MWKHEAERVHNRISILLLQVTHSTLTWNNFH